MKRLSFLLSLCLISCMTVSTGHYFFGKVSTKLIPDFSFDSVGFQRNYLDDHFPVVGTLSRPLVHPDIVFDSLMRYRVIMCGKVMFKDPDKKNMKGTCRNANSSDTLIIDTVELSYIIVSSKNGRVWYSDSKSEKSYLHKAKTLDCCPIPISILRKLRMAFLTTVKGSIYVIGKDINSPDALSVQYAYKLY